MCCMSRIASCVFLCANEIPGTTLVVGARLASFSQDACEAADIQIENSSSSKVRGRERLHHTQKQSRDFALIASNQMMEIASKTRLALGDGERSSQCWISCERQSYRIQVTMTCLHFTIPTVQPVLKKLEVARRVG